MIRNLRREVNYKNQFRINQLATEKMLVRHFAYLGMHRPAEGRPTCRGTAATSDHDGPQFANTFFHKRGKCNIDGHSIIAEHVIRKPSATGDRILEETALARPFTGIRNALGLDDSTRLHYEKNHLTSNSFTSSGFGAQ
jgi:hypothetical protein